MSLSTSLGRDQAPAHPVVIAALVELALTSIHHGYGAIIYTAPFRWQVVVTSAIVAVIIIGLALAARGLHGQPGGRVAFWLNAIVILGFPVVAIGLIEGGYNHVVKNIIHLGGDTPLFAQMFPAGMYEPPGDWFFELTGVAQLPVALVTLWLAIAAVRRR